MVVLSRYPSPRPGAMRRRFTLIELLVVVTIIAILAAMLLPVLAQARLAARKTATINNMKSMVMGFLMYAEDCDDQLIRSPCYRGGFVPALMTFNERPDLNLVAVATQYGFVGSTGHPVMSAEPWGYADGTTRNTRATANYSNYDYNVGLVYDAIRSPMKLTRAEGEFCMLQELVMDELPENVMRAVYLTGWYAPWGAAATNPSLYLHESPQGRERNLGAHAAFYDASVRWIPNGELTWYNYGGTYWLGHVRQPRVCQLTE